MLHPYKKNAREIQRRQWNVGEEFEEDSLTKYSPHLDHALYLSCGRNPEPLWAPVCGWFTWLIVYLTDLGLVDGVDGVRKSTNKQGDLTRRNISTPSKRKKNRWITPGIHNRVSARPRARCQPRSIKVTNSLRRGSWWGVQMSVVS